MSLIHTDDAGSRSAETPITPAYMNRPVRSRRGMRRWMILAPVGAGILLAGAAALLLSSAPAPDAPLVEPPPVAAPERPAAVEAGPVTPIAASVGEPRPVSARSGFPP